MYCLSWYFIQTLLFLVSKCQAAISLLTCDTLICSRLWNTQNTFTYPIEIHAPHYLCKSMTHERYKWITLPFVEYQHLKYLYKLTGGSIYLQFLVREQSLITSSIITTKCSHLHNKPTCKCQSHVEDKSNYVKTMRTWNINMCVASHFQHHHDIP